MAHASKPCTDRRAHMEKCGLTRPRPKDEHIQAPPRSTTRSRTTTSNSRACQQCALVKVIRCRAQSPYALTLRAPLYCFSHARPAALPARFCSLPEVPQSSSKHGVRAMENMSHAPESEVNSNEVSEGQILTALFHLYHVASARHRGELYL